MSPWFVRRLRRRSPYHAPSFPGHAQDRRRARLSKEAGLRKLAFRLKQRCELNDLDDNYRSLVATALEEASEGRFTICGFANVYLVTFHHESLRQKNDAWWNAVLQLIRDVLQVWKWDPEAQAWVSERDESSRPRRSETALRVLDASMADDRRRPVRASPVQTFDALPPAEDG